MKNLFKLFIIHYSLFTICCSLLIVHCSAQDWFWLNPKTSVNGLNSIKFVNTDTGFAVGQNGTILKTTDGGNKWISHDSLTSKNLNSIFFVNSKVGYIVGDSGVVMKTTDCGSNWIYQSLGINHWFNSVFFINKLTGFIGSDSIFKTTDGGVTWRKLNVTRSLGIYFTDSNNGYSIFDTQILKTTNGGDTWFIQYQNTKDYWLSLYFSDIDTGFVVGAYGYVTKTTDGGKNWIPLNSGTSLDLYSVYFADSKNGFIVGNDGLGNNTFLKTTNGGNNWITLQVPKIIGNLSSIYFTDKNIGYCVSDIGVIIKTTDGGNNWVSQNSITGNNLYSTYFNNSSTGYVVGSNGSVLKTTDGGYNWINQKSGTTNTIKSVYFTDINTGYCVGYSGTILKTTNGGGIYTGVNELGILNYELQTKVFPNPVEETSTISYQLSVRSMVNIKVYDITGKGISILVDETQDKGEHKVIFNSSILKSGIYFCKINAGNNCVLKKILVLK